MLSGMKTTLVIEDGVMRRLKILAAARESTLSAVVEEFLRLGLRETSRKSAQVHRPLPAFDMGLPTVDLSDRTAIDDAIDRADRVRR